MPETEQGLDLSLLTDQVVAWAETKRWWPGEPGESAGIHVLEWLPHSGKQQPALLVLRLELSDLLVQVPILVCAERDCSDTSTVIATQGSTLVLDGVSEPAFWGAWTAAADLPPGSDLDSESLLQATRSVQALSVEQSNSSVLLTGLERPMIAKVYRVLHQGQHPEAEIPAALAGWAHLPTLQAVFETLVAPGHHACGAVLTDLVPGARDGFELFRRMVGAGEDGTELAVSAGEAIGEMHNLLEQKLGIESAPDAAALAARIEGLLEPVKHELDEREVREVREFAAGAAKTLGNGEGVATRVHGDLHLGQMLLDETGAWQVVDFEGEPLRPLEERRAKDSPARDVAGMLRSFDYAGQADQVDDGSWSASAQNAFLDGYTSVRKLSAADVLWLRAYQLEKALYELQYEAKFRPAWKRIPLEAIRALTTADS